MGGGKGLRVCTADACARECLTRHHGGAELPAPLESDVDKRVHGICGEAVAELIEDVHGAPKVRAL